MKKNLWVLIIIVIFSNITFAQKCKPDQTTKDKAGVTYKWYGGRVRSGGLMSNDKSVYNLYILQAEDGIKGTVIYVSLYEPVESINDYKHAMNNFLNDENLKKSSLQIQLNGETIITPTIECSSRPEKLLGSVSGYSVFFQGEVLKSTIEKLQKYDLQNFRLLIGGHVYERTFKNTNNKTTSLMESFNCVNMEHIFDLTKKTAEEMDLTEVPNSEFSKAIIGKWTSQKNIGEVIEFNNNKVHFTKMGRDEGEGTFKIAGNRLIITSDKGNKMYEIGMFLRDMVILKENGGELTFERIK